MRLFLIVSIIFLVRGEPCGKDSQDSSPQLPMDHSKPCNESSHSSCSTSHPKHDGCNFDDEECINGIVSQFAAPVIKKIIKDVVECSHSLEVNSIPGNFSTLKYHGSKNNVTGLKNCVLKKINVSPDVAAARFTMECPAFTFKGDYDLCGYFLYIPVIGKGTYEIEYGKHSIKAYAKIHRVKGCDDQTYLQFGDFTTSAKALSPIKYNIKNLYNGNAYLTKIVNNFASCHWEEMSYFTNEPTWNNVLKLILYECNKKLLKAPAENMFIY